MKILALAVCRYNSFLYRTLDWTLLFAICRFRNRGLLDQNYVSKDSSAPVLDYRNGYLVRDDWIRFMVAHGNTGATTGKSAGWGVD